LEDPSLVTRRFELRFESIEAFTRELESNLRRGRTFVPGEVAEADRSACIVAVFQPQTGVEVTLAGEIVFAKLEGPGLGIGIDLVDVDLSQRLAVFAAAPEGENDARAEGPGTEEDFAFDLVDPSIETTELDEGSPRSSARAPDSRRGITIHERVRKLGAPARDKLARMGNLSERTALERAFGASVWDALLENPQMTGAEIARIAKNGMAPATILGHIANNAAWLAKPEVRRALLSNSRLPSAQAERVLRALPATELRLVPSQAGYPAGIRALARRLLQR
jgi:hypothetical protein